MIVDAIGWLFCAIGEGAVWSKARRTGRSTWVLDVPIQHITINGVVSI